MKKLFIPLTLLSLSLTAMQPSYEQLSDATLRADVNKVKQLLESRVSPNPYLISPYAEFEDTPLHKAAGQGQPQIVKLLLDYGAKVNVKSSPYGETPLHKAVIEINQIISTNPDDQRKQDYIDAIALLLEAQADPKFTDHSRNTAISINKIPEITALFEKYSTQQK